MIKLNDNSIEVGEIKQILKDFNLPKCAVGQSNAQVGKHYIEDNAIYRCYEQTFKDSSTGKSITTNQYELVQQYAFGNKYQNLTQNLRIENMLYDRYTHRYLGKYLRFIRDYKSVDLMSMYNCFDNEADAIDVNFTELATSRYVEFDTNDNKYSIYTVPVSKTYVTIKLNANVKAEICAVVDVDNDQISDSLSTLASLTYMTWHSTKPFLYDKLINVDKQNQIEAVVDQTQVGYCVIEPTQANLKYQEAQKLLNRYSSNIRLLIKVPKSFNKSITVLEGDYVHDYTLDTNYLAYKPDLNNSYSLEFYDTNKLLVGLNSADSNSKATMDWTISKDDTTWYLTIDPGTTGYTVTTKYGKDSGQMFITMNSTNNGTLSFTLTKQQLITLIDKTTTSEKLIVWTDYSSTLGDTADSGYYQKYQLFSHENDSNNYLLADRLIEYITGNAITPLSEPYDIRKIQKYLIRNKKKNNKLYPYVSSDYLGIWSDDDTYGLRQFTYDYKINNNYDTLGYVDKNVEIETHNQLDAQDDLDLLAQIGG